MVRILLPAAVALGACSPSPQESAMHNSTPAAETAAQGSSDASQTREGAGTRGESEQVAGAKIGPIPQPVPVTENPLPGGHKDSPAEAQGRRTLSTAYVMLGPEGRLAVTLRDGRALVLRDVVLGPKTYCGRYVTGGKPGGNFCGGYGEVAAAEPGAPPILR